MNNKPIAWIDPYDLERLPHHDCWVNGQEHKNSVPLYTHPVKEQKCVVQNCENHMHEGSFNGDLCSPCYQFIAHGKGVYSQAYRNTHPAKELDEQFKKGFEAGKEEGWKARKFHHPAKELTDEEIMEVATINLGHSMGLLNWMGFAKAILRKAQEKC